MKQGFRKAAELVNKNKEKEDNQVFDDDRPIADMNVPGFSWYVPQRTKEQKKEMADLKITRKERWAMIMGALSVVLPMALVIIGVFFLTFLIVGFWLS